MVERPTDWSVQNGAFIGYLLINQEDKTPGNRAGMKRTVEGWLAYCCDLRQVHEMKRRGLEDDDHNMTCLYHSGTLIAVVNAPIEKLQPEWLKTRHLYDEPKYHLPDYKFDLQL